MALDWRRKYGWLIRERNGWLIGTTSRVYALFALALFPMGLMFATARFARADTAQTVFHVLGGVTAFAAFLTIGLTNEVRVDLRTGAVHTRRGLFGIARTHHLLRPQIDGIFMTIHEDARHPNRHYCAVGFQAGLRRWAIYRTMDSDRGVAFYRDLREATGYPGLEGY